MVEGSPFPAAELERRLPHLDGHGAGTRPNERQLERARVELGERREKRRIRVESYVEKRDRGHAYAGHSISGDRGSRATTLATAGLLSTLGSAPLPSAYRRPVPGATGVPMPGAPRPSIDRRLPLAIALVASLAVVVATALASSGTVREAEAATTATVTFAPVADSYVQAASPATNSGSDKTVRAEGSPVVRSYLRFMVAGLPAGATVSSARLRLYARSASSTGVSIHGGVADTTWGEKTITFTNAPTFSLSPLAASGTLVSRKWTDVAVTVRSSGMGRPPL